MCVSVLCGAHHKPVSTPSYTTFVPGDERCQDRSLVYYIVHTVYDEFKRRDGAMVEKNAIT